MARPWELPARVAWRPSKSQRRARARNAARDLTSRSFTRVGHSRAQWLFYTFALLAVFLLLHLYLIHLVHGPALAAQARDERLETIDLAAKRGTIFDRDGAVLVRSLPSQSVYATPRELVDVETTARVLGRALGMPSGRVLERLRTKGGYILIGRKIDHDAADRVLALNLSGISVVPEETGVRFVPSGRLASTVLGFTGVDENGLDGIEYSMDRTLRGQPGRMSLEADQWGRAIPFAAPHVIEAAKSGRSIALTLDSFVQYNVEQTLRETVKKWHARSGSAIVMDPWTGEIVALANVPDYDVTKYDKFAADARRDRAVTDTYEPGSTFKLITAAAALDSKKVTTYDRFPARDRLEVGGHVIHNAEDGFLAGTGGSETLEDIVAYSHNVGAAEVAMAIGSRTMYDMIRRFGFTEGTHVDLPGETPGLLDPLKDWSATTLPTVGFGHSVAVTPLALARAYCAIANGGLLVRPHIVGEILGPDGRVNKRIGTQIERRVISAHTASVLRRFLRAVVVRGTGNPTAQVAGYTTAGKTGTAQVVENGRYAAGEYVASFVGYVPAERPKFVILVKVERPRGAIYGSEVAAPAFSKIAGMLMMHAGVLPAPPAP
ncbi:MAG: penicillin-binding protein 2, partial [Candidatus Eremiobacteraeota bacterium]|nr:penicillin-binding protein 2 [Candidatus Eremiobacteraeota bacterium]